MTQEVLKLALEALEFFKDTAICQADIDVATEAITAIKDVLAQHDSVQAKPESEQEPVAWMEKDVLPLTHIIKAIVRREKDETYTEPLYITPPQRTWVGLTPQERDEINEQVYGAVPHHVAFHHAIEAKLKEKNT